MKRTGFSVGGGALIIPMKAAQWRMKPKKFLLLRIIGSIEQAH